MAAGGVGYGPRVRGTRNPGSAGAPSPPTASDAKGHPGLDGARRAAIAPAAGRFLSGTRQAGGSISCGSPISENRYVMSMNIGTVRPVPIVAVPSS